MRSTTSTYWFIYTTCLKFHSDARSVILEVVEKFKLNKDKIEPPEIYLGGRLDKNSLNGKEIWTMSSVNYVKGVIKNVEVIMIKGGMRLPRGDETPMSSDYIPELDASTELESDGITMYQ